MNNDINKDIKNQVNHIKEEKERIECDSHERIQKTAEKQINVFKQIFSIHDDLADNDIIRERMISGGKVTGTNMIVLICAIIIASIGLNMNSTAVIIGAMLISPIMGTILSMSYAVASADMKLLRRGLAGFSCQFLISLLTSFIYFLISPINELTSELAARTMPTVWDVAIAFAGGVAGIVGITRKEKSNTVIPGVAIATALMPPICTCGFALANGQFFNALGAFYLFLVNTYFIFLASTMILLILKVPKTDQLTEKQ